MGLKKPCDPCPMIEAIKSKQVERVELLGADGRYYEVVSAPLPDQDGKVDKAIEIVTDITERKQAEEELRREKDWAQKYLDVAKVMTKVMTVVIDADKKVSLINRKGCEILGFQEKDIIGKNWFDTFIPERMRDEVSGVFGKLVAGKIKPVEYFERKIGGW